MRISVVAAIACVALTLSACGNFKDQAIYQAEDAVRSHLKDPSSATFDGVFVVYGAKKPGNMRLMTTCGYVNSRNSFGALAGKTRFIVSQIASKSQGKMSSVVADVNVENPVDEATSDGMQTFFDMQWEECSGQRVPEGG